MSIKSDKTFEEIVERLVALFKPQRDEAESDDPHAQVSSADDVTTNPPPPVAPAPQGETQS